MKIKTGSYVKVKPSTCKAQGLDVNTLYLVVHFHDVPPAPVRMKKGVWYPPHPIVIKISSTEHKSIHVEDCAVVTPEEMAPPKRWPVDRVAVLQRLRRDFCLKEGRYPTPDLKAHQAAREEARSLRFADKLEPFNPVTRGWSHDLAEERAYLQEIKLRTFGLEPDRFIVAAHGPNPMTAEEHDLVESRMKAADDLHFEKLQGLSSEWASSLSRMEFQVCKSMGLTADMVWTLNHPESEPRAKLSSTMIKLRETAKRLNFVSFPEGTPKD